jgi:hypothetical protein
VAYDGTNFQMLSPQSLPFYGLSASGATTYNLATASGTQNIAHGLGVTPKMFRVVGLHSGGNGSLKVAQSLSGSSISANLVQTSGNSGSTSGFTIEAETASDTQTAVITADATNIILTWTRAGTPSGTLLLAWDALA